MAATGAFSAAGDSSILGCHIHHCGERHGGKAGGNGIQMRGADLVQGHQRAELPSTGSAVDAGGVCAAVVPGFATRTGVVQVFLEQELWEPILIADDGVVLDVQADIESGEGANIFGSTTSIVTAGSTVRSLRDERGGACSWRHVCDMSREDACSDIAAVQAHLLRGLCVGMVREGANVSVVPGRSETGRSAVVWGRIDEPVHPVVLEGVVEGNDGKRVQERVQPR